MTVLKNMNAQLNSMKDGELKQIAEKAVKGILWSNPEMILILKAFDCALALKIYELKMGHNKEVSIGVESIDVCREGDKLIVIFEMSIVIKDQNNTKTMEIRYAIDKEKRIERQSDSVDTLRAISKKYGYSRIAIFRILRDTANQIYKELW